jgi:hypothetical protein
MMGRYEKYNPFIPVYVSVIIFTGTMKNIFVITFFLLLLSFTVKSQKADSSNPVSLELGLGIIPLGGKLLLCKAISAIREINCLFCLLSK